MTDLHEADHQRLDAAVAAWVAARKPRTRDGGRRGQLARTLGLRIDSHLAVFHKVQAFPPPPKTRSYVQALELHKSLDDATAR